MERGESKLIPNWVIDKKLATLESVGKKKDNVIPMLEEGGGAFLRPPFVEEGKYRIYKVTAVEDVMSLKKQAKYWDDVRDEHYAKMYLQRGPLYFVYKNGNLYAQGSIASNMWTDINGNPVPEHVVSVLTNAIAKKDPEKMAASDDIQSTLKPFLSYNWGSKTGRNYARALYNLNLLYDVDRPGGCTGLNWAAREGLDLSREDMEMLDAIAAKMNDQAKLGYFNEALRIIHRAHPEALFKSDNVYYEKGEWFSKNS